MNALRSNDNFSVSSVAVTCEPDLLVRAEAEPANLCTERAHAEKKAFVRAKITEIVGGQKHGFERDYRFEQLPMANDNIVILNRRGRYDIMRVMYSTHEPEATIYVRWVAHR
jgi:hypothetical protein